MKISQTGLDLIKQFEGLETKACRFPASMLTIGYDHTAGVYQNWRQQWRLLKAMEMLCDGWQLSYVAQQLEFVSDSAFITFFRQHTGTTPARYSLKNIAEKSPR